MYKVYLETFGCQMNVADSAQIMDLLGQNGYLVTDEPAEADLIAFNTCSVRDNAEARAKKRITEFLNLRRKHHRDQAIWVIGCMAQRQGDALKKELPGIDRVIGACEIETLHEHIVGYLDKKLSAGTSSTAVDVSAFVPVMRGCDNHCSYCIVPTVRGPEHSLPAGAILDSIRSLVERGTREITLLGQNVNSYRDDSDGLDFTALLEKVHAIEGLLRIRFTTSHPKDCSDKLIRTVADLPKIAKHLHLPVQSGSTRILKLMNRTYTREDYLRLIDRVRAILPTADLTTDIMTGFPSETVEDFADSLALIKEVRYTASFMFAYSPRPATPAASMSETVPEAEAKERLNALIAVQTEITKGYYLSMVGKTVLMLPTLRQTRRGDEWMGQDEGCKRILLACRDEVSGMILPCKVTATSGMTLLCERGS